MDFLTSKSSELQFGSAGCQYVDKGNVCGEKDSLAIIAEMQKMYEEKMSILDKEGGGDYEALQAKNRLQEMWIKDLIQQSKMLISAIQELEREATDRVRLLEQRIKKNSHAGNEVLSKYRDLDIKFNVSETFQNAIYLQSDIHNLMELIKRFQCEGRWSTEGLHFHFVNSDDFLNYHGNDKSPTNNKLSDESIDKNYKEKFDGMKKEIKEKDLKIKNLESTIKDLRTRNERSTMNSVEELKKAMDDMRTALTTEVAEKHEIILGLRRDIQQLEEQCRQADKQMIFKDDIIKEMRKDIKQFKSELRPSDAVERKRLVEDICRYQGQQQNLNIMIETLTKENGEKQGQGQCTSENMDVKLEDVCRQIQCLKAERDEIVKNYENLSRCYSELSLEHQKLKDQGDVITKTEHEKIKNEIIEKTKKEFQEEIKQLLKDREFYKEKYESSLSALEKANREKEKREQKIKELGCAIMQCEEYQKKYEKGLEDIEKIRIEKEQYEKKIKEMEHSIRGFEDYKLRYDESLKEIENLRIKAAKATKDFEEELKLSGAGESSDSILNDEKECLKKKATEAIEANNKLQAQYLMKLEEKMEEVCMLKQQIEELEGKEQVPRDVELESERCMKEKQISNLKDCIKQLEGGQANTKLAADSLQSMVNLYRKSVTNLEESEKSLKNEISQQNVTIINLQEALLATKQELEELRQKASKDIYCKKETINSLYTDLLCTEENFMNNYRKGEKCLESLISLRDEYLDLEVENFNNLQDVEMLHSLLLKYQQNSRLIEQSMKAAVKKMKSEKQEYENIIGFLKNEMAILSEQLQKLQQLLKIANTSNLDLENQNLADNLIDAQAVNNVLQEQLKVAETQLSYEIKMNRHYIALVEELQDKQSAESVKNHRLQQKIKDFQCQLDKSYAVAQSLENTINELENTILIYEKDLEMAKKKEKQQDNEIDIYQKQLKEAGEKFTKMEKRCKELEQELELKVQMMAEKENKIRQDYEGREKTRNELIQQLNCAKEELGSLRTEMNKTISIHSSLRSENENLKYQLNNLHVDRKALEQEIVRRDQQIEQYSLQIQAVQADKEVTEQKYTKLKAELQGLQSAFDNLSKQYMNKTESLISLEMELVDTKSSHTQLCNESKKVVDNVRSWLEEQKEINTKLERNIREKEDTINKLKGEIRNLRCHLTLPNKLPSTVNRQRESFPPPRSSLMQALSPSHPWSLGSQGSESSYSTNALENEEETMTSDVDTTESWLYRVESMTEQLQRSNNYWKTRINDYEYVVTRDQ